MKIGDHKCRCLAIWLIWKYTKPQFALSGFFFYQIFVFWLITILINTCSIRIRSQTKTWSNKWRLFFMLELIKADNIFQSPIDSNPMSLMNLAIINSLWRLFCERRTCNQLLMINPILSFWIYLKKRLSHESTIHCTFVSKTMFWPLSLFSIYKDLPWKWL